MDIQMPHTDYAIDESINYRKAEAAPPARYDGVRYGLGDEADTRGDISKNARWRDLGQK